jgi:hypothetical protein
MHAPRKESKIYEGRVSREELEDALAFEQYLNIQFDPSNVTREEVEHVLYQIRIRLRSFDGLTDSVHDIWQRTGFTVGTSMNDVGHMASRLDKLYLREAGALIKSPSDALPDASREAYFAKESERLREYKTSYARDKALLREQHSDLNELMSSAGIWDNLSGEDKASRTESFMQKVKQVYDAYVELMLEYMPGRTFINRM